MHLEWMQQHRSLVAKFIRFANAYTLMYNKPVNFNTTIDLSAAQIQTLEYIMENENTKMSDIARKLGVTRSTFSKNAKNLIDKGLLKKYRREDNKKDIYLFATDFGKEVYHQYTDFVYNNWYQELFKIADTVPQEYLDKFEQMLDWYTYTLIAAGKVEDKIPGFIPVEDEKKDKKNQLPK